ncbi:MAG TPA: hypothetical protein VFU15_12640 [Bacteroidia bacterium]|nr:hypothetical protein [Bacteroidia bacterium]
MKYFFPVIFLFLISCGGKGNLQLPGVSIEKNAKLEAMQKFHIAALKAQDNILLWVAIPGSDESKVLLSAFISGGHTSPETALRSSFRNDTVHRAKIDTLISHYGTLLNAYKDVTSSLNSIADYNDPARMLPAQAMVYDNDGAVRMLFRRFENELTALEQESEEPAAVVIR